MTALLTVDRLCIATQARQLVRNLSFSIAPGERLGLIGESGSGKSLTSLALIGLLPETMAATGSIRLDGTEVIGAGERQLVALRGPAAATIFQEPLTALDPLMRVGRQVGEVVRRRLRHEGLPSSAPAVQTRVLELLSRVALPDPERLARVYPHEMSGGQRQRVAIAMALAWRPKLLVADEPTTALDVTTQAEILALIGQLVREDNMALLFISHDIPVVAGTVDSVAVLRQGELVEAGPVSDVLQAPADPYTRSLVAAARTFDTALGRVF
ncbi:peptide/nickel transport system ATP-binding protein [Rhizobium sp. RU35A]|uniref:ATP-binding cassette domain-containing protein n=1 Tax=Rhizobium sp. RU35A TaxID=1907414 RepID=UPI00095710E1|nr:ABC transporter ATP-binding protein [Rhizobium sp. RU35A]SIQ96432.1 peptide/nickel transport system ATP-binding protein [Rhizobium sp. RU35A]